MNGMQLQVQKFHERFGLAVKNYPDINDLEVNNLRGKLIAEEAIETIVALSKRDLPEVIDGLCDLLYVTFGTAVSLGIDIAPFFHEVHKANMAKIGGKKREDGKWIKPEGWKPPDIAGMLDRLLEKKAD